MSLNGFADGPPTRTGPPIVDLATGMSATNAILLALAAREKLGRGQHVEVALFDIAMAMTSFYGMAYLITGQNPGRFGNSPNGSPTVGVYEAADGPLYMACANDRLVRRLLSDVFERPDLLADPRFDSRKTRTANRDELRAVISSIFRRDTLENWIAKMKKANVPVGYLRTVEQGFNAPEARERKRLSRIPHPTAGAVPNIEPPVKMTLTPVVDPVAAPLLGQHTREVLRKTLGYDDRRLATLTQAGAFGKTAAHAPIDADP
jgi:crotonobetainyl-CoA:carnitine CoA-transferase CaiB-like acyl-CoA transferase